MERRGKMNLIATRHMTKQIEKDDPECHVTGTRKYGPGDYAIDVVDTRTGTPFTIHNTEDWYTRVEESKFTQEHDCYE
jgi:hypothetical protein